MPSYDEVINFIGSFGPYQKRFFYLIFCPMVMFGSMGGSAIMYMLYSPETHCIIPESLTRSYKEMTKSNVSALEKFIPTETVKGYVGRSQCLLYNYSHANWTYTSDEDNVNATISCVHGYEYDRSDWSMNMIMQFDLVCDRTWIVSFLYTGQAIGGTIGYFAASYAQDNFGRKITFFIFLTFAVAVGSSYVFSYNWQMLAWLIGIKALATSSYFNQPWVLTLEMIGEEHHTFVLIAACVCYGVGIIVLTGIAYFCRTWKQLVLAANLPGLIFLGFWFIVDESPRWLLSRGKTNKAVKILTKMAKYNKVDISSLNLKAISIEDNSLREAKVGPWTLFKSWGLTRKTLLCSWMYTVVNIIYYGLTLNAEHIGGNIYLVFALLAAIEIPAAFLARFEDTVGRVATISGFLMIATISLFASAVSPWSNKPLLIFFSVITKLCITTAYDVVVLFIGELYPTVIRGTGIAVCTAIPFTLSIATSYIVYLAHIWALLPMAVFSLFSFTGIIATLCLPETLGYPLMDTLEQEKNREAGSKALIENVTFRALKSARKHVKAEIAEVKKTKTAPVELQATV